MAQNMVTSAANMDFTNSLRATATAGGNSTLLGLPAEYVSPASMRQALFNYDSLTYPTAVLNIMTVNDMTFALRNCKDPDTISDYISPQAVRT